ncbi:hypothetical protein EVAR_86632_1 [Eumeta japonica]|uniref:Uncharacterized protein n=1 Tax=Eumeta variegata TaxID=151549 RepID=A0A4C1Z1Q7_EUMVA|nr:hypothetical protein EVAR_86632_1 [Eumeta japonica]
MVPKRWEEKPWKTVHKMGGRHQDDSWPKVETGNSGQTTVEIVGGGGNHGKAGMEKLEQVFDVVEKYSRKVGLLRDLLTTTLDNCHQKIASPTIN